MRSGEKSHLKKFSDRLESFYSNWRTHQNREWRGAKLIVFCAPPSSNSGIHPDQDSLKFCEWLFGECLYDAYIILSLTEIYAVCSNGNNGLEDATFLSSFAEEAKKRVGVDFVVKDKGSGRTFREALVEMANGLRMPMPPPGMRKKERIPMGFIGEEVPENELTEWMECKDVTDAFCRLAGFK